MFDASVVANNIKKNRVLRNMTQQDLARELLVSAQSVSKWECGQSVPDIENLYHISGILNVSIDVLLGNIKSEEKILIGVDGGGSKTEFVMFNEDGRIFNRIVLGGANPNTYGMEACCNIMKAGLDKLLNQGMNVTGVFIGCAGFMSGNNAELVKTALKKIYPQLIIDCGSDILNIIGCGSNRDRCIAAICGTGSIVYANDYGKLYRVGGGGCLFDKYGSGYDIGRETLYVSLQDRDGIGEKTCITQMVEERLGTTVWNCIPELYKKDSAFIASFAPIAFEAYKRGDKVAKEILEANSAYLAKLINYTAKTYQCGNIVTISGSILSKNTIFIELLKQKVDPALIIEVPEYPPIYGACVRACEILEVNAKGLTANFMSQYKIHI